MLRHFEQRTVLAEAGQGVQLLVKRNMIARHGILEGLLRRLAPLPRAGPDLSGFQ